MKRNAPTLFRQNLVLIVALIAFGQILAALLFYEFSQRPRIESFVSVAANQLKTIAATVAVLPPEPRATYLAQLNRGGVVEIGATPVATDPNPSGLPRKILQLLREDLADTAINGYLGAGDEHRVVATWSDANATYWLQFQAIPLAAGSPKVLLSLSVLVGLLSLIGALMIQRHLNRPLDALVSAAAELAHGAIPPTLSEEGPREIAIVAQGFNRMVASLSRIDHERALMLAGVSHDLRTPLTKLRLAVGILENDIEPELAAQMVRSIEEIDGLLDQFLDFARVDSAEDIAPVDLPALARDALSATQSLSSLATITGPNSLCVTARPRLLRRLLVNLLDNAAKYGSPDAARPIEVRITSDSAWAYLSVIDQGGGVPAVDIERLMRPFTRGDRAGASAPGSGLGLAIVTRIAEIHRGNFCLMARKDGYPGMEARVTLPLV